MSRDITWWRGQDLNLRPSGYEPDELPNCSTPRRKLQARAVSARTQHRDRGADRPRVSISPRFAVVDHKPCWHLDLVGLGRSVAWATNIATRSGRFDDDGRDESGDAMTWSTSARVVVALGVVATAIIVTGGADAANPIPDEGLPSIPFAALPIVSERTEVLAAGVTGINTANDSFPSTNIRVTSFAEIGSTMYVGGKFKQVFVPATGIRHEQPFVAAFDRNTGAWISSFRPTLDGNVWDLHATADGRLIVAGQFTNVNGVANTRGVAMLDPSTGAVDPSWRGASRSPGAVPDRSHAPSTSRATSSTSAGTSPASGERTATRERRPNRPRTLSTGIVDGTFLPDVDGIVFDIDATPDRVYVVGNFFYVDGVWSIGMVALEPADAKRVPGLKPWVRTAVDTPTASYQQAILAVGDEVWQGGSQHNRQVYRKSDYQLIRSWVSHPWGDAEAFAQLNGIVYSGSHANGQTRLYRDADRWPS